MYDAIVIGARCAGAPTAMLLARRGHRVLLVDRATFPSDTLSGHAIQPAGVATLARWGLLDRLRATGVPAVESMTFDVGSVSFTGTPPAADGGISAMYVPRRTILDMLLVDAAAEAGVEVRERFRVKELVFEGARVVGVRAHDADGRLVEERAAIIVGADGARSFVARSVGAMAYAEHPAATVNAYAYFSGVDVTRAELYVRPDRFLVAVPTHDDLVIINQAIARRDAARYRSDIETEFAATLALAPSLAERVAAGRRVERFRFTTDTDGFLREPWGPGWALVGDAGYHKDPITAQGMLDAFRDAELLAAAIDRGFEANLESELAQYQLARDHAVRALYDFTCHLSHVELPPPPEMQALFAALPGNQIEIDRFFGVLAGTVAVEDFLDPVNVERIIARTRTARS